MTSTSATVPGHPSHHAFGPLVRAFLLDARFNRSEIVIDFGLPLVVLLGNNARLVLLPTARLHAAIAARGGTRFLLDNTLMYVVFILWTTVINLVITQTVQLREDGYLAWLAHMAGSPLPVLAGLWTVQVIVATAESLALSLLAMLLLRTFVPALLLAVLVGSPIAITLLTLLCSPILCLKTPIGSIDALITLLTIALFCLPQTGSTPVLTALLGLNPLVFCRTLLLLVAAPLSGTLPAYPRLLGLALAVLASLAAGLVGLRHPALRPMVKR